MKKFILFLSLIACADLYATVRTVSNQPGLVAQYSTIAAAVTASSNGDTVYVPGSNIPYAGFTIADKRLTIIGPGWAPMQNFMPFEATVDNITITGVNGSNTEIQGLHVTTTVSVNTLNHPDNLRFIRNHFGSSIYLGTGTSTHTGYVFEGNWFESGSIAAAPSCFFVNFLFKNNLFYSTNNGGNVAGLLNCSNVLFDHNLWYGPSAGSSLCFGSNCRYLLLTNNIFVRRDAATNNSLSVFSNNLTFNTTVSTPWTLNGNSGSGNISNQDPQMVSQTAVNSGTNDPLLNFTIAAGPADNAGTDGKDLGLLYDAAGSLNWTNSRMSRMPYVYSMSILNPSVAIGGLLTIQVEARKNN